MAFPLAPLRCYDHPFLQDCEVSDWEVHQCTVSCGGGGTQNLTRSVTMQPFKGTECPPLELKRACGTDPCPVHCVMDIWSEWSHCSAECDGGVKERVRDVVTMPVNGGDPCDAKSGTVSCNVKACDRDCLLTD